MPSITIQQMCDAVATTLAAATGLNTVQSVNQLSEGLGRADLPLLQVYWQSLVMDAQAGTDRAAYQGGVRYKLFTLRLDLYAAQRVDMQENMADVVAMVDNILGVFEVQNTKPYFALAGIKAFRLDSAERVVLEYTAGAGGPVHYMGARFELGLWVY